MFNIPFQSTRRFLVNAIAAATSPRHLPISLPLLFVTALASTVLVFGRVPGDLAVSRAFWAIQGTWLVDLMLFGDTLGGNQWLFILLASALLLLATARRWHHATLLAVASSFFVLSPLLKESIQRPRPWVDGYQAIIQPAGYSFPSGHALGSGLIIGGITLIVVLALGGRIWLQMLAASTGLALLGVIGASRVYLGAHWTSDVIAGYMLAGLFLLVAVRVVRFGSRRVGAESTSA